MAADSSLERTVDKIIDKTRDEISSGLDESFTDSIKLLTDSLPALEQEYDRIMSDGRKEAEKLEKQLVGSSDLEARNKLLLLVEESVGRVFAKAVDQIRNTARDAAYSKLLTKLLEESTAVLGTSDIVVTTNATDREAVGSALSRMPGARLSDETAECLGGVIAKSADGTMTFDNTLDARLDRMKPLIRKEIASKFGL